MQVERWPRSVSFITERFKFFHAAGRMLSSPLIRLAVRSTPSPILEKAFIVVRFVKGLIALSNHRQPSRLLPARTKHPRGSGQRSWTPGRAQHDRRGKMKSCLGGACSYPGNLSFSLPRGAGGQGHSQFYSSCFHVTNRFFVSFLTQERNVPSLRPPVPLVLYAMLTLSLPPPST